MARIMKNGSVIDCMVPPKTVPTALAVHGRRRCLTTSRVPSSSASSMRTPAPRYGGHIHMRRFSCLGVHRMLDDVTDDPRATPRFPDE